LKQEIAKTLTEVVPQDSSVGKAYQESLTKVLDLDGAFLRGFNHIIFKDSWRTAMLGDAISSDFVELIHQKDYLSATKLMLVI
jgi:hypothetical protein